MDKLQELKELKSAKYAEYQSVCREIAQLQMKSVVEKFKAVIPNEPKKISFEFSWEWNDEDGTDPNISYITVTDVNGEEIDIEEHTIETKSKWSDRIYECNLDDYIRDEIYDEFDLRELLEAFDTRYELEIEL